MSAHEVLIAARALIADERDWTKGQFLEVIGGRRCLCSAGALRVVLSETGDPADLSDAAYREYDDLAAHLSRAVGRSIITFNDLDTTTHADILAAFDRAIEATKPGGAS